MTSVRVKGLRELNSALRKADAGLAKGLRSELRQAAEIVSSDARSRFIGVDRRAAMGMRPRVRGHRAFAEQRRGRTTGKHPEFGALQMRRAFIPALASKRHDVEERVERMLDRLADGF